MEVFYFFAKKKEIFQFYNKNRALVHYFMHLMSKLMKDTENLINLMVKIIFFIVSIY